MKSPQESVKASFGEKAKLVAELEKFTKDDDLWVSRTNASKGLAHVSNAKLLRLHKTFTEVKEKFGTRAKLIAAICELEKRVKDEGYKARLGAYPVPRLYDLYKATAKRIDRANKPVDKAAKKAAVAAGAAKKAAAAAAPAKAGAKAKAGGAKAKAGGGKGGAAKKPAGKGSAKKG